MKKISKKVLIVMTITMINLIANICFVSGQDGALGHGPDAGEEFSSLLGGPRGWGIGSDEYIYNTDIHNIIDTTFGGEYDDSQNPIRVGTYRISGEGSISGLVGSSDIIDTYETALQKVLRVVQNIVNYTLGLLSLIALIYIMIHGFMVLTAAGDDTKSKKGYKGIKNAFIAIAGIGISWLIISGILRLIKTVTA